MKTLWRAIWLCVLALPAAVAPAASYYVQIPGINGQQSVPNFPNAMNVKSLTIAPQQFGFVKTIDAASPQLSQTVANGTNLPLARGIGYDGAPTPQPNAFIIFAEILGSSYQTLPNGTDEQVTFASGNPGSLYLELPGIAGEQNTLGHPNVMKLNSVTLTANDFTIVKPIDSASAPLFQATAQGTNFPEARLLFYDQANPAGPPQQIFSFSTLLVSSYQTAGLQEQVTLSFAHIPEPASATVAMGAMGAAAMRRRGQR
jgi:type VI protein secretion system component Hcp